MNDISVELSIKDCFQLMNKLQQSAATFQETGGVHNAAICDKMVSCLAEWTLAGIML